MKRRKGVTVFSALALSFLFLAAAAFAVVMLVLAPMFEKQAAEAKVITEAFDIIARNKDILAAFTKFDQNNLTPNIAVFASIGLFVILTLIWLIVDLKRGRKICFFFICIFLFATYVENVYYFALTQDLQDFVKAYMEQYPVVLVPVGCAALSALASVFAIILFIVDMATGRVEKPETPTFIKEPTEEVEEGVFEEVKDENEEPAPAPAPVLTPAPEEKEEEVKEEEEAPAPAPKKTAPKKVKKPEPKKKAEPKKAEPKKEEKKPAPAKKAAAPKKEEKKPAPKKEEKKAAPAPAAKKDDARKTQTITLTNEDGNSYAKAYHVSRRPELNKWQVKATGSDKALKLFNTQKEAIEYADQLAKNQNVSIRVHSKEGKIRKHNG